MIKGAASVFAMLLICSTFLAAANASADEINEGTAAVVMKDGKSTPHGKDSMNTAWSDASSTGAVLKLLSDWQPGAVMVVPNGNTLTLDLNGHIVDRGLLKYEDEGALFKVESNAALNIIDSDPNAVHKGYAVKGGVLTGGKSGNTGGCIEMQASSEVSIEGCSILSCSTSQDGGAIRMDGVCRLVADGTGFYNNYTLDSRTKCYGGAVYVGDGTAIIKNAVFDSNYCEDEGGAVYMNDGELQLENVMFRSNHSRKDGGAVYCNGTYNDSGIKGCTFVSNSSDGNGGALYVNNCKQFIINASMFSLNSTNNNGGAISVFSDKVILANSTVTGNKAQQNGGGIYADSRYDLGVQGKVVVRNNTNTTGLNNDLCLQSGVASTAYLSNGGLYEGSMIYLTSTTKDRICAVKDISKYQASQYIRTNKGNAVIDEKTEYKVDELFVYSVVGEGNIAVIIGGSCLIVLTIVCIFVSKKVLNKKNSDSVKGDEEE